MNLGTAIITSTIAVLAYHFFLIPLRENRKVRKIMLCVLGIAVIAVIALTIWVVS